MSPARRPTEDRAARLMMGALDEELSGAEEKELARLLERDPSLAAEWRQLKRTREVTMKMSLRQPPPEVWETYWAGVYRRLERRVAWILVSVGAVIVLSWAGWHALRDALTDPTLPLVVRGGIAALVAGGVVLLVSVLREKIFLARRDPYKDVTR